MALKQLKPKLSNVLDNIPTIFVKNVVYEIFFI